jgi:biopolymer transport protein ExbB
MFLIQAAAQPDGVARLDSIYDMLVAGGPVMVPLALCSVIALMYGIERLLRLRASVLGTTGLEEELLAAVRAGGTRRGIELCELRPSPAARVMRTALVRWPAPFTEREKLVEEAALREVRALSGNLRPLHYIAMLAPLLGFLGTVYGMIVAFTTVALHSAVGNPELLAAGISQALITTAAGLTIAIPTQVAYYWLKSRVERFARSVEAMYAKLGEALMSPPTGSPVPPSHAAASAPDPAPAFGAAIPAS